LRALLTKPLDARYEHAGMTSTSFRFPFVLFVESKRPGFHRAVNIFKRDYFPAASTTWLKPFGSRTARSASILRLSRMPPACSLAIRRL
jgi:hypothetical protein